MTSAGAAGVLVSAAVALVLAGCAAVTTGTTATRSGAATSATASPTTAATPVPRKAPPRPQFPSYPSLLPPATSSLPTGFVAAVRWQGQTAAWIARSQSGIALLSLDQRQVELRLHSGTLNAGGTGWRWGPAATGSERGQLAAAFNGGFKFSTNAGGFMSYGRVGAPLRDGLGSIVTYANGHTDIGAWHAEVPAPGMPVASVRQNLTLLIDHGSLAPNLDCLSCWGATIHGEVAPARSALGITADGHLIWAAGEHLTASQLADALTGARVVRAVELDINPDWVAGYLYGHRGGVGPLAPVPVVPGQTGVAGFFLVPYSRDFFTVVAR